MALVAFSTPWRTLMAEIRFRRHDPQREEHSTPLAQHGDVSVTGVPSSPGMTVKGGSYQLKSL